MSVVDDYLAGLGDTERVLIGHMYAIIRQEVPDTTEELSYAMPAFKYKGKGLVAIMANNDFLSLYPFCSVDRLSLSEELKPYEQTKGSIHFSHANPISDDLLRLIITARCQLIEK